MEHDREYWDRIWKGNGGFDENVFFECVVDSIIDNMGGSVAGRRILEAGAGTGTSSLQLARRGAIPTLVDYSPVAIEKMQDMFERNSIPAVFLLNDIRRMDAENNSFDLVFNAGVMEHFSYEEQVRILREMKRVCKDTGRIIVLTPNARCLFYRLLKWLLETNGTWPWGPEQPVVSLLRQFNEAGLKVVREYSVGFLESLEHLACIKNTEGIVSLLRSFYYALPAEDKNLFEGYLVCTVGAKT
ncbi:Methyltransferase type 11 [Thermincola potens JR]|uniref:Methyltransferase type 11 n=2 Tax=Thermincola TaxID=278993 RepID=D5XDV3_THEPJ|nr:Methyltransferase type 11 [Thermincola potens JR]